MIEQPFTFKEWLINRAKKDYSESISMRIKTALIEAGVQLDGVEINSQYDLARFIARSTLATDARAAAGWVWGAYASSARRARRRK